MSNNLSIEEILQALRIASQQGLDGVSVDIGQVRKILSRIDYLEDYKEWYEEAMEASNKHGYVGMSAAQVINDLAYGLKQAESKDVE
ncbi:hypothetical protein [Cronobacter phage JC01]|uniref:Uncharacterized protein n=1 Tax=Cronobacter phage JC01 TaxID=2729575 RepID=A0A6M3YKG2_9CAUD|nr:hypothetical protein JT331_gp59 [Cronobacter phage JC01]QJI52280.1 hypothetical protein [Cronobacter phage JC01]